MKILHTSDWHLGHLLYGADRGEEQAAMMDQLETILQDEKPDALIVSVVFASPTFAAVFFSVPLAQPATISTAKSMSSSMLRFTRFIHHTSFSFRLSPAFSGTGCLSDAALRSESSAPVPTVDEGK